MLKQPYKLIMSLHHHWGTVLQRGSKTIWSEGLSNKVPVCISMAYRLRLLMADSFICVKWHLNTSISGVFSWVKWVGSETGCPVTSQVTICLAWHRVATETPAAPGAERGWMFITQRAQSYSLFPFATWGRPHSSSHYWHLTPSWATNIPN